MITFEEVCRIIKKRPEPKNQRCDKNVAYELPDGWAFCFGKKDVVMCPPISFFVDKENGDIKAFTIPPISNLEKLKKAKVLEII